MEEYSETIVARHVLNTMELTSLVFEFLKEETLKDAGIKFSVDEYPTIPRSWTTIFAQLARVNKSFFHASTAVLWENMSSLEPFFAGLLPADKDAEGNVILEPLSYYRGITKPEWDRFQQYSSLTKSLCLEKSTLKPSSIWINYITLHPDRPPRLFPNLKKLFLSSTDPLSFFVASSVASHIKYIRFALSDPGTPREAEDAVIALAKTLAVNPGLARVCHVEPYGPNIPRVLWVLGQLTSLYLKFTHTVADSDIGLLDKLANLEELYLEQEPCANHPIPLVESTDITQPIARASGLGRLRKLTVKANGSLQFRIAAKLSPLSLNILNLAILHDEPYSHVALVPHAIAIHTTRNKGLVEFVTVNKPLPHESNPDDVEALRGDLRYNNIEPMLSGIATLSKLKKLSISNVPFFYVDMTRRLLKVVQSLSQLVHLVLTPIPMTDLEEDDQIYPTVAFAEDLSRLNQHLKLLVVYVLLTDDTIPTPPEHYISTNKLETLYLFPALGEPSIDIQNVDLKLALASYLDHLFPHLKSLTGPMVAQETSWRWKYWTDVEKFLFFSQKARARTVKELSSS